MVKKTLILPLLLIGLFLPVATYAQETVKADSFPVLKNLRGEDEKLHYDYLGKEKAVHVWILSGPGIMQTIYTLPDGHAIVGGTMVSAEGKEISSDMARDFMARSPEQAEAILVRLRTAKETAETETPEAGSDTTAAENTVTTESPPAESTSVSPSESLWAELGQTGYVSYGSETGVPVIYAILDPVQAESKSVWQTLSPLAKANQITLHVIPLALETGDSIMEIASVLGSDNPPEAWDKLMQGQSVIGGDAPDGEKVMAIEATIKLAQRLNLKSLPFLIYRVPQNGEEGKVRMLNGVPKDWNKLLTEMNVQVNNIPKKAP